MNGQRPRDRDAARKARATIRAANARDARSGPSDGEQVASSSVSGISGATMRTLSSTLRQGSSRGSWNTIASRPFGRRSALRKRASSPAINRSNVVLPQPDGPTIAPTWPGASVNAISPSASWRLAPGARDTPCPLSRPQAARGRQREALRSKGCTTKVSIASITPTKGSA